MQVKISVDALGLKCPMPLLKAKQALNQVAVGEVVEVKASDAASMQDIKAYAELSSHELVLATEEQGVFTYRLKKQG
jgi:tRNA 2-thiouridine synthesizing protein A